MKVTQEQLDLLRGMIGELDYEFSTPKRDDTTITCLVDLTSMLSKLCAEIIVENAVVTDNLKLNVKWPKDKEQTL